MLVFAGRLITLKRVDMLIEAMLELQDFRLRIIGGGPEAGRLKAKMKQLGLESRIEFMGTVSNGKMSAALEKCSLMILPTDENQHQAEQFGKAAVEALSMRLPVMTSRTGNFPALARLAPAMKTFKLASAGNIATGVRFIMDDYPTDEARDISRRSVLDKYSAKSVGRQFREIFLEM